MNDLTLERIARVAHAANRAYCETLGYFSQVSWDSAKEWQKQSAIAGVKEILLNPDIGPREHHQKWVDYKKQEGWIFGPIKDEKKKQHPCMVPYDLLPFEQKMKDYIFGYVVKAFVDGCLKEGNTEKAGE